MKRVGNLYARIADPDNLRLAFWKASRGKRHKPDAARFRENLGAELGALRRDLLAGAVSVGDYHYFTIRDPKERTICAAPFRERVLHHAVLNLCEPVFEAYQIHASYACRPGKGVHAAVARARGHARAHPWHLKLDVRQYFASIDHGVLLGLLARRFKDHRLLDLFAHIIASYTAAPGKGVPIGNLTSQEELEEELEGRPCFSCLFLLSAAIRLGDLSLSTRSKRRFARKLGALERGVAEGRIGEAEAALRAEPLVAFTRHAAARGFRQAVLRGIQEGRGEEGRRAASRARTV